MKGCVWTGVEGRCSVLGRDGNCSTVPTFRLRPTVLQYLLASPWPQGMTLFVAVEMDSHTQSLLQLGAAPLSRVVALVGCHSLSWERDPAAF